MTAGGAGLRVWSGMERNKEREQSHAGGGGVTLLPLLGFALDDARRLLGNQTPRQVCS